MNNLLFYQLEQELYNTINKYTIPFDGKYYVLKSVFENFSSAFEEYVQEIFNQQIEEEKENNNQEEKNKETKVKIESQENGEDKIIISGSNFSEVGEKMMETISPNLNKNLDNKSK